MNLHIQSGTEVYCFRVHSNGWFIAIPERFLNQASRDPSVSNRSYRMVKKLMGFSHSEMTKFLTGYRLYVTGYSHTPAAAFFCSYLN